MADQNDFATAVGGLIKGRAPSDHNHYRIRTDLAAVQINASGGVGHYVGGQLKWWVDETGRLRSGTVPWSSIPDKPSTFAPSPHRHDASEIDGIDAGGGGVQIFANMGEAVAWEAANPGKVALALDSRVPSAYGVAVLADKPAVYLPLDEDMGAGTVRNYGTEGGSWTVSGGSLGAVGIGDGATGYRVDDAAADAVVGPEAYLSGTAPWTAEVIVSPIDAVAESRMLIGVDKTAWAVGYNGGSGSQSFFAYQGGQFTPGVVWGLPPFTQHVAATYDGTTLRVYRNGALYSSRALTAPIGAGGVARVGASPAFAGLRGTYAGAALYPGTALPEARIRAHAQAAGLTP